MHASVNAVLTVFVIAGCDEFGNSAHKVHTVPPRSTAEPFSATGVTAAVSEMVRNAAEDGTEVPTLQCRVFFRSQFRG